MPYLRCFTESLSEGALVRIDGDVDLATAPLLADAIAAAFRAHSWVILDLGAVPYLDSSGLHLLAKTAARHAGRFVVIQARPRIRRLLEILGIMGLVPVAASLADAQQYLRNHGHGSDESNYGAASCAAADDAK
jgi:anti-sigma B factor antagonist